MDSDGLLAKFRKLQNLPKEQHWFCPRLHDEDDLTEYTAGRTQADGAEGNVGSDRSKNHLVEETKQRVDAGISCLQLLAFDSEDLAASNEWYKKRVDEHLTQCDACVRGYHQEKRSLLERLREEHEEHEVAEFARILGDWDLDRICRGLDEATQVLKKAPPDKRSLVLLEQSSMLAIFEALSAEAALSNEKFLQEHFDEPFRLVQTKKQLRIQDYVPAMGVFVFQDHAEHRQQWARRSWLKMRQSPTADEFSWAIHDPLLNALQTLAEQPAEFLESYWYGISIITDKLNKTLITHSLRALDVDVYRLGLDQVLSESVAAKYILQTFQSLLMRSPDDFWDAMGTIPPASVIEAICSSRYFQGQMQSVKDAEQGKATLRELLSWLDPCMESIKLSNQPPACRAVTIHLMERPGSAGFSDFARIECFTVGLKILSRTLRAFVDAESSSGSVGRVVVAELMEIVSQHINEILSVSNMATREDTKESLARYGMDAIRNALALDCQCFKLDYEAIERGTPVQHSTGSYSHSIWKPVANALVENRMVLAKNVLVGMMGHFGLEEFAIEGSSNVAPEKPQFNKAYRQLTEVVSEIYLYLGDYDPEKLDVLFEEPETAIALIAGLFAAEQSTFDSAVNVVKVVSSSSGRREAIAHLFEAFHTTSLNCFAWALRRMARRGTFAPAPRMLKTCGDVLDILCNSQDGLLRTKTLSQANEKHMVEAFWRYLWQALQVIFRNTENWGHSRDKDMMKEFCRDTMQFAEKLFDQYSIFASAVRQSSYDQPQDNSASSSERKLLECPRSCMTELVKWLRLRDDYLVNTSVSLVCKILKRLGEWKMPIAEMPWLFIENVVASSGPNGKPMVKTALSGQQKAELSSCLDEHLGKQDLDAMPAAKDRSASRHSHSPGERKTLPVHTKAKQSTLANWSKSGDGAPPVAKPRSKSQVIDLEMWQAKADSARKHVEVKDNDELEEANEIATDAFKARHGLKHGTNKQLPTGNKGAAFPVVSRPAPRPLKDDQSQMSFKSKREKERLEKQRRDREEIARMKKNLGGDVSSTLDSRVNGLGVKGKEHGPAKSDIMVSSESDESEDDDNEIDLELFGIQKKGPKTSQQVKDYMESKRRALKKAEQQGPIKKAKVFRSEKDMRARLVPDLTSLHRTILGWEFFYEGDIPPNLPKTDFRLVSNTFKTVQDYQSTFEPLHVLEAWQGLLRAKEEGTFKTFDFKVASRTSVDSFNEVATSMPSAEQSELGLSEADLVLVSKSNSPAADSSQPHCLARITKINRKKAVAEITYKVVPGTPLLSAMSPNVTLKAVKLTSLTPLEREYGALRGLQYYDLCDEVINAKPSPLLKYGPPALTPLSSNYGVNTAQAKAIRSAVDNDAFTLIQGPPGSGKTKTIVAIVGAILTNGLPTGISDAPIPTTKKLLVCAPSNAAVDELVMRLRNGVKSLGGEAKKLNIVRMGRSDAINSNVIDVTLEELVNAKLNVANGNKANQAEEIHKLVEETKAIGNNLTTLRGRLEETRSKGQSVGELQREYDAERRKKTSIGSKLDSLRDKASTAARDNDLNRRRIQQSVLDGANVICATLSGSGHEMFQHLKIDFETVIIDEAAQSIELSALIPLKYGCSKCILVGDPKQLPPTVLSREAARFQYEQSLFVRMQQNHPDDVHLLDTQYRMHPEISQYPSKAFYDSRLLDGNNMAGLRRRPWHESSLLGPYRFFDVQGQHKSAPKGHSLINVAELEVAMQLYHRVTTDYASYAFKGKIGIITPYKSQLRELKSRFSQRYGKEILEQVDFNTTDAFQGRESEIIIFSCVRAAPGRGIGFLDDIRRMNVGLTRAKSSLWVLGNSQTLLRNEFWGGLVENAKSRDRYTEGNLPKLLNQSTKMGDAKNSMTVDEMEVDSPPHANGDVKDVEMVDAPLSRVNSTNFKKQPNSAKPPQTRPENHKPGKTVSNGKESNKKDEKGTAKSRSTKNSDPTPNGLETFKPEKDKTLMDPINPQPKSDTASNGDAFKIQANSERPPLPPSLNKRPGSGQNGANGPSVPPPRKKREADPFIRRERKRPRPK